MRIILDREPKSSDLRKLKKELSFYLSVSRLIGQSRSSSINLSAKRGVKNEKSKS